MRVQHRSRAIASVLGTLIFLLVAIASMVVLGSVVSKGLSFNQASINAAAILNNKNKEALAVSSTASVVVPADPPATPECPPSSANSVLVRNTGSTTSNITFTFGVDSSGNLWTCPAPSSQSALAPGANETFFLPSYIANGFTQTGVITSLGNTFYTNAPGSTSGPGVPVMVGGSLYLDPGALLHFDVASNPLGDGYALNGYGPWPTTGGVALNLGSVAAGDMDQMYVIFGLTVRNLETARSVSLNEYSYVSVGGANWYIVDSLKPESAPYSSGVDFNPYDPGSPPTIGPGQTVTLYFASPCPYPEDDFYCHNNDNQGLFGTGPTSAADITVALFGTYSDGTIYSGSADLGVGYYTCLNPVNNDYYNGCDYFHSDQGVQVTCDEGTPCPVVADSRDMGPFNLDIDGFVSAPKVYLLNQGGTVSDITDSSTMSSVSFSVPPGTSVGVHQIFITDGVNFVDATVTVEA